MNGSAVPIKALAEVPVPTLPQRPRILPRVEDLWVLTGGLRPGVLSEANMREDAVSTKEEFT